MTGGTPGDPTPVAAVRRRRPRRGRAWRIAAACCAVAGTALAVGSLVTGMPATAEAAAGPAAGPGTATPILSARRAPTWTTETASERALRAAVQPVADAAGPGTCIGVGDGSATVASHNGEVPFHPASNQKLLTAAAALGLLGPEATLDTDFRAAALPAGGVLAGDLHVLGGGDPLLTTDAQQRRQRSGKPAGTDLEAVADQLVAAGINRIEGSVVGDAGRFDGARTVEGWAGRWVSSGDVAPLSALVVNDAWLIDPITGEGPGGPAEDPAAHAAAVMTQLLRERGVEVVGEPRSGPTPGGTLSLLSVPSAPVGQLVEDMLRFSDNTTSELLLKEIGARARGAGTTAEGAAAVTEWARSRGWPMEGAVVADGSGLAPANRMTCELLGAVLRAEGPEGAMAAALAVPGSDGTLSRRLAEGELPDRVRAKTGTLNEVTALSGWIATRPGATLDFQMVTNTGDRRVEDRDLDLQALLLLSLLDQPVAPPLEAAGPLPPEGT